jgi:hypothetical protein
MILKPIRRLSVITDTGGRALLKKKKQFLGQNDVHSREQLVHYQFLVLPIEFFFDIYIIIPPSMNLLTSL